MLFLDAHFFRFSLGLIVLSLIMACGPSGPQKPQVGMQIKVNTTLQTGMHYLAVEEEQAAILLSGDFIDLDLAEVFLRGDTVGQAPDQYRGIGIKISNSKNVTIRNGNIRGYRIGIYAENVDSLRLIDCDLSYNYKQRLYSTEQTYAREDNLDVFLEQDRWQKSGTAIYLQNCRDALVTGNRCRYGQQALILDSCQHVTVVSNDFRYNSALGIGLFAASNNTIAHNVLDCIARSYSPGFYQQKGAAMGIYLSNQANDNQILFNSITLGNDGIWSIYSLSQEDEDRYESTVCKRNLIYANQLHHLTGSGIISFLSEEDIIIQNDIQAQEFGMGLFRPRRHKIIGNYLQGGQTGIEMAEAERDLINHNYFYGTQTGIRTKLLVRDGVRDVNQSIEISQNFFDSVGLFIDLQSTDSAVVMRNETLGRDWRTEESNNTNLSKNYNFMIQKTRDKFRKTVDLRILEATAPYQVEFATSKNLPEINHATDYEHLFITEWGPYDFTYPLARLRQVEDSTLTFALFGPQGNWKVIGGDGITSISRKTGAMPATLVLTFDPEVKARRVKLEFIGEAFTTPFGDPWPRGKPYAFGWANARAKY